MWRRAIVVVVVGVTVVAGAAAVWLVWQLQRLPGTLRAAVAGAVPGVTFQSLELTGTPPGMLVARGITVANPPGFLAPAAASAASLRMRFSPWLWLISRVVVADLEIESPMVVLERDRGGRANWEALLESLVHGRVAGEADEAFEEAVDEIPSRPPVPAAGVGGLRLIPTGLRVTDGRFDLVDRQLKPDGVLVPVRAITIRFDGSPLALRRETATLEATGDFVDRAGAPVGAVRFDLRFSAIERQVTGNVRFEHRALVELQEYVAGRTPYRIVEGDGYAEVRGRITGRRAFWCEMSLVARRLVVSGEEPILGMPPQELLRHLQDADGVITLTFEIEGRLDDPAFDFHEQLVRQLDQAILARLAERGVALPAAS